MSSTYRVVECELPQQRHAANPADSRAYRIAISHFECEHRAHGCVAPLAALQRAFGGGVRDLARVQPESVDLVIGPAPVCESGDAHNHWPRACLLSAMCGAALNAGWDPSPGRTCDDFVACPVREHELVARVLRLLAHARDRQEAESGGDRGVNLSFLVGHSRAFTVAVDQMRALARSDAAVILTGETGTGKELFARAIHYLSRRRGHPFLPVHCGSLPDPLFENELFGHVRGAYTGAVSDQPGLLATAEGGTLLLDEIDSLTPAAQVKLLRFLQDREYRALGASRTRTADVRIVAATNADLRQQVLNRTFREDLFHRLNVLRLNIPALRDRADDIPCLAGHFLRRFAREENRSGMSFSRAAMERMQSYAWPGNVRELEGAVHRAAILSPTLVIQAGGLDLPIDGIEEAPHKLRDAKRRAVEEFERTYLIQLLAQHNGNVSRAAREAGKERRAFQRLLHKYGIERRSFETQTAIGA